MKKNNMNTYYAYCPNALNLLVNQLIDRLAEEYSLQKTNNPKEADFIISIGGDGTFLEACKLAVDIPIVGVNKGTLGYLTEVEVCQLADVFEKYINNDYCIKERMTLSTVAVHNDECKTFCDALNDVVIQKKESSIIGLEIYIDDVFITSYLADGVIISTPTGSTGYSLSCGGPIIAPYSDCMVITPIAPHTMINRSIVVSEKSKIDVVLTRAREDKAAKLSIDGKDNIIDMNTKVTIKKGDNNVKTISFYENSFFENIKNKMM